ncbi:PhoPQ-activated pathogenicity-related family protein [Tautonia plasticadhaerens]|uniref:PhoPQ-activated pathogenicity-related protein n=1 Tax=Tautonia plasticadhaerens TaxID=2527974 RepID=A0A518H7J5_9BACT|nr:PhoPQ-activated protein PqaA family protein [Tautonia plasticadhaerens]QDV36830.1 PhoPQ-activated pathogenicity-related protein [Tautonia plasticadhaerens]
MPRALIAPTLFLLMSGAVKADLTSYVLAPDPSFSWELSKNDTTPTGTVNHIDLTSQTWRGIPWTHQFRIYEPTRVDHEDFMVLFITGGSSRSEHKPSDDLMAFALANAAGCRVAVLPQVPNQPLLGDRYEDDLISETFMNFLKTGEHDWPLLQPMVKSAVRAMDAAQEFAASKGKPVERFVVTGASKRGWTTWLTGAVDDRVAAIAPMVIPTLNMKENVRNQLELWGKYSEQIEDYTRRGLTETFDTEDGRKLWRIVDPYFYLDAIDVPVVQINGTNDRYWAHDSMRFYWDDIRGAKYVVNLPNAGHGLEEHREYAINGVGALVRHVATGQDGPEFSWKTIDGDGEAGLELSTPPGRRPKAVTVWVARSADRDLRDDAYEPSTVEAEGTGGETTWTYRVARPDSGSVAAFFDLTYEIEGIDFHLSTPIHEFRADPAEDTGVGGAD